MYVLISCCPPLKSRSCRLSALRVSLICMELWEREEDAFSSQDKMEICSRIAHGVAIGTTTPYHLSPTSYSPPVACYTCEFLLPF